MEKDLGRLFSNIEERLLRERAYTMVRERREDWTSVYRDDQVAASTDHFVKTKILKMAAIRKIHV